MAKPLSLAAPIKSRDGTLTREPYPRNVFFENQGADGSWVYKRPGLSLYSTNTAGSAGQGITSYKNSDGDEFLFTVDGGDIWNLGLVVPSSQWVGKGAIAATGGNLRSGAVLRHGGLIWIIGDTSALSPTRFVVAYSSDEGANWTILVDVASGTASFPPGGTWNACVHNNRMYLVHAQASGAATNDDCWYSSDGATWTQASASTGMGASQLLTGLVSHDDGYMYAFRHNQTTDPVYKSADGVTWASAAATAAFNTGGVARVAYMAASFNGNLYTVGGSVSSANYQKIYYSSDDGANWAELGTNVASELNASSAGLIAGVLVPYRGIMYLIQGTDNATNTSKLWSTTDLQTWTLQTTFLMVGADDPDFAHSYAYPVGVGKHCAGWINGRLVAFATDWLVGTTYEPFRIESSTIGAPQDVGNVGTGLVDFAQNYNRTILAIKGSSSAFSLNIESQAATQVTDGDYPDTTVRGLVYLDGYFFVMDPDGNIYNSASEDFTSWAAADVIAAEFEPDGGVALAKHLNYIVAFGEFTTEFFFDAGNATNSPLLPVQNGIMQIGCADGDTLGFIDTQLLFVGQSKGMGQSVARGKFVAVLNGVGFDKLSTPDIDRILEADDFLDVDAVTFKTGGHAYYALRLGTSNISLVFDLTEKQWYVWSTRRTASTSTMTSVVTANGTATYVGAQNFADGDVGVITGFTGTHTALNGTFNMTVRGTNTGTVFWRPSPSTYTGTSTNTGTATSWASDDFPVVAAAGYAGKQLLQDKSNGNIYELDVDTYQDNSVWMDCSVTLPRDDDQNNERKFEGWADLISDRSSGGALMRMSDDDGQSWTAYKRKLQSTDRTRWHRLGNYRRRMHQIRVTDNYAFKGERLERG